MMVESLVLGLVVTNKEGNNKVRSHYYLFAVLLDLLDVRGRENKAFFLILFFQSTTSVTLSRPTTT